MKELALFAGAGGGLLGTHLLGWEPVGYVEFNDYCQRIIRQRILDGILPNAPIFGDIRAFINSGCAELYRGVADVITAGFPCQPFSVAGKRAGADDERNMWPATIDTIRLVRPRYCLLENVPGLLTSGYFGAVLGDLADLGFNARWGVLGGADVGAISDGKRLWIVASSSDCPILESLDISKPVSLGSEESFRRQYTRAVGAMLSQDDYSRVKRNPDAVAAGMERLRATGNGQNPFVAAAAWDLLHG